MIKKILLLLALLALIILTWFCVYKHHPNSIQQDISDRVQEALDQENMTAFSSRVDGREVYLTANTVSESERDAAVDRVESIWGVRTVTFEGQVGQVEKPADIPEFTPPLPSATLDAEYDGNSINLSGVLASTEDIALFIDHVQAEFGQGITINNNLVVGSDDSSLSILKQGLAGLSSLSSGSLSLNSQVLTLSGEVASPDIQQKTQSTFAQLSSSYNDFDFNTNLQIAATYDDQACQKRLNALVANTNIRFESGKADIRIESFPLLKRISVVAQSCDAVLHIKGHTDSNGNADFNLALSQQRAASVKEYLNNSNVDASRLKASGFGESQPIADNSTATGRAVNRRIEFNVE